MLPFLRPLRVLRSARGLPVVRAARGAAFLMRGFDIGRDVLVRSGGIGRQRRILDPANWVLHRASAISRRTRCFRSRHARLRRISCLAYISAGRDSKRERVRRGQQLRGFRTGNKRFFGIRACAASGDSGGSVDDYSSGQAYGRHMASSSGGCTETETSFFSPIDSIEAASGVTVRTGIARSRLGETKCFMGLRP